MSVFNGGLNPGHLRKAFDSLGHDIVTVGPFPPGEKDVSEADMVQWVGEGKERRIGMYYYDAKKIVKSHGSFDAIVQVEPGVILYNLGEVSAPSCFWSTDSFLTKHSTWLDKVGGGREYMEQLKCNFYSKYGYRPSTKGATDTKTKFLPMAVDPEIYRPMETEKLYDVVFIGSDHATLFRARDFLLKMLSEKYSVYKGHASFDEYCMWYAKGRLAFNNAINGEMGMRFFELMAMGACQLTNIVHGQEILGFYHLEHLINYTFYDVDYWVQIYKDNTEACRAIGQAAREKVLAEHTFVNRAETIIEELLK